MSPANRQIDLILQSLEQLPTLSPVAVRLLKITSANDAQFDQVIRLIESDPALSAKILSLCRRADMGAARAITTVRRAAVMLGMEAVHSAVLSVQIYELMKQAPGANERRDPSGAPGSSSAPGFDRSGFWKHAIAVGSCAELIAAARTDLKVPPEEAFVAGLVHDLGKLALDWLMPNTYEKIIRQAEARRLPLSQVERSVLGLDHHQAGKRLAEHWSLPHALQDSMWLHGQTPDSMPDVAGRNIVGVVAIANGLCRRLMLGWSGGGGSDTTESLVDPWCRELGIAAAELSIIAGKLHEAVAERCRLLGVGEHTPESLVVESLGEANRRLSRMQDLLRNQTKAAAGYAKALAIVSEFASGERPGGNVADVLTRIAHGWAALMGKPPLAIICQSRQAGQWRFMRFDPTGALIVNEMHEPPAALGGIVSAGEPADEPMDLRSISRASSLGGAFELAQWLSRRLGQSVNISRLGMMPLASALGPAAAIVHENAETPAIGAQAMATVTTIWSWAIGAATQSEGSRRLAEQLAQTARELSETQARLSETESMARLGEFTSGAAHEMNNPLTIISARAQMLAENLRIPREREDAIAIVRAAENLTELITQLHMVARPPLPRKRPVDINEWVQGVIIEARRRTGSATPVVTEIRDGLRACAFDGSQIGRALTEVIVNALQAAPKSRVVVRIENDRLSAGTPSNTLTSENTQKLRISVVDDGRGMSDHVRKHAFDPFFSDQPAGRRHGLGLALAKRVVETHAGRLLLESRLDKGTAVTLTLPVGGAGEAAEATGKAA